jgi:signal transduction histidine kinase
VNSQVEPAAKGWEIGDVLDAALQALINDRCRKAYIHELRGGLQAIHSSFELLARSAKQGAAGGALIEHASALAKRAMTGHERLMLETVDQLTVPEGEPVVVNMVSLMDEVHRFLRNDALSRNIRVSIAGDKGLQVSAAFNRLRTMLLGLLTLSIDALPVGAELKIEISRANEDACVSFYGEESFGEIHSAESLLHRGTRLVLPRELILAGTQHWLQKHGGRVVSLPGVGLHHDLRIYYPLFKE